MRDQRSILGLVGYTFLPCRTGGHRGINDMYEALGDIHEVSIMGTDENHSELPHSYRLTSETIGSEDSPYRYVDPRLFFKVKKLLKKNSIDVLQVDHPYFGWLGILIKWFTKTKFYLRSHNIEFLRFKELNKWWWPIMRAYESLVYKLSDKVLFITDEDLDFAQKKWKLKNGELMTFGTWVEHSPTLEEKARCREQVLREQNLSPNSKIINFNGPMAYYANKDALNTILTSLAPAMALRDPDVHIILCGSDFPQEYQSTLDSLANVSWAGFVDDLNIYLKGSDQFWNPIQLGGGIKTKLVQALSQGLTVISYKTGSIGLLQDACADKLHTIEDGDWQAFLEQSLSELQNTEATPKTFYDSYYWLNIVKNVEY